MNKYLYDFDLKHYDRNNEQLHIGDVVYITRKYECWQHTKRPCIIKDLCNGQVLLEDPDGILYGAWCYDLEKIGTIIRCIQFKDKYICSI